MHYYGAMPDDHQTLLVRRAKANDAGSFGELMQLHASRAFAAAVAILGNRHDAEDAVQEATIEAFRSIRNLREDRAFGSWFVRIAVNKSLDRLRRRRRQWNRELELEGLELRAPDRDVDGALDMAEAVGKLPPEHQAIVRLYYVEGYRTPEIAQLLGAPEGTVRRRLSESYRILRLIL